MKTKLITVRGKDDAERTASLRAALEKEGHHSSRYEWWKGEPIYHGEPTQGFFNRQGLFFAEESR